MGAVAWAGAWLWLGRPWPGGGVGVGVGEMMGGGWEGADSHFDERRPMCSLSTVSLVHSTFFSGFRFRSLMVRLRFSCKGRRYGPSS